MTPFFHGRNTAKAPSGQVCRLMAAAILSVSIAGCGAAERIGNIGKPPPFTPIKDVKAPLAERTISLPLPEQEPLRYEPNSLWRAGARAFFKDQRARKVGDILTVNIRIDDQAQIGNTTTRTRQTEENVGLDNFFGLESVIPRQFTSPGNGNSSGDLIRNAFSAANLVDTDTDSSFQGNGQVNRSESITLTLAAIVTNILPNGNLVIQGRQEMRVNSEKRELLLAGIIRPEDVTSDNTIDHTQIAEARVSYGGKGQLTDAQQPRYGQQLFDIVFPF